MNLFLLLRQGAKPLEGNVDVPDGCVEVENGVEIGATGDLRVSSDELTEVPLLLPGPHRVTLDDPVRLVPSEAGINEGEQQPVAEEEMVAGLEVTQHAFRVDDQPLDDPDEAVEHVVERQERVGNDEPLGAGGRDVPLVPERNVLEPDLRRGADGSREAA